MSTEAEQQQGPDPATSSAKAEHPRVQAAAESWFTLRENSVCALCVHGWQDSAASGFPQP